jgi:uncharacterized protein (TIGR03435 family)
MTLRVILSWFPFTVVGVFGQNPVSVKAGDPAPDIVWTRILRSAEPPEPGPGSFVGQVTVLVFFPNVSANESLVSRWNELVAKFADQPVSFVWVASEQEPLDRWLEKHLVSGWLLLEATWDTARAYGMEMPGGVIIDINGRIAGFTFMIPTEREIKAVQEGRVLAIKGDADDSQMNAILAEQAVRLDAEPHRWPLPEAKPDIPPSYEVHISPSDTRGTASSEGTDHFVNRGFGVRAVISKVYERDPSRIVLPAPLDDEERYDFVLVPPREMEQSAVYRLVQQGIERHFRVSMTVESRLMDVYAMTALEGKTPAPKTDEESRGGGSIGWSGPEYVEIVPGDGTPPTIEMLREMASTLSLASSGIVNISADNSTMDNIRLALEQGLNCPILDETNLKGTYDIAVQGARSTDEFLWMLRDRAGIVLTRGQRDIEMLVVKPEESDLSR